MSSTNSQEAVPESKIIKKGEEKDRKKKKKEDKNFNLVNLIDLQKKPNATMMVYKNTNKYLDGVIRSHSQSRIYKNNDYKAIHTFGRKSLKIV